MKKNNNSRKEQLREALFLASNTPGVSGFEMPIHNVIKSAFKPYVDEFMTDNLGSIVGVRHGNSKDKLSILLDAHMDEIGFMVKNIDKNGFIRLEPLGGWWSHVVLGKRMRVYVNNFKKYYVGVIGSTPPHILTAEMRNKVVPLDQLYLDLGVKSAQEVADLGIQLGDPVVKDSEAYTMANPDFVCGKSFDNRACVAAFMQLAKELHEVKKDNTIYLAGSVQEEVGLRGAQTVAQMLNPDIAIVHDTTIAFDQPKMPNEDTKLGHGIAITVMDRCAIGHKKLVAYLSDLAKELKIPFTYDMLVIGGTNAGTIHTAHAGVMTVALSVPTRYIHSHNEVCHLNDLLSAVDLLKAFLNRIDRRTFNKLRQF